MRRKDEELNEGQTDEQFDLFIFFQKPPNRRQTVHLLATPDASPWSRTTPSPETWAQNPWTGACVSDPSAMRTHRATVGIDAVLACHWIPWRRASGTMLVSKEKLADWLALSHSQQNSGIGTWASLGLCFALCCGTNQRTRPGHWAIANSARAVLCCPKKQRFGDANRRSGVFVSVLQVRWMLELATTGLFFGFCTGL